MTSSDTAVQAPDYGFSHDLRVVKVVLQRDIFRFLHDVGRAVSMLFQGVMMLFVIGVGFGSLVPSAPGGADLTTVMFPGVITMVVIGTAMSSAASIVSDREFGFLREMLAAPARRIAIALGKVLAGALLATFQGCLILAMAGFAGIPYAPSLLLTLVGMMFLVALTTSALGVLIATAVKSIEAFMGVSQIAVMPLVLLSGALFPVGNLPAFLGAVTLVNPVTYAVDPMRQAVFAHVETTPETEALFNPGITWFSWQVPWTLEVAMVGGAGLVFLVLAVARFRRAEH
ncbi:ABC transporter permease [Nocardiopsis ansamitocini]|uniref:Transport permease protein n=1 Tax=Nocardiopsis ansamitocini TaxID=1670832 RepID=A0A9W6PAM2_9ACTN|nr:ABC transporter permease [Nocardiopsis ansamitocini]GLU50031.1 transport permease protein [Nocardiopsis ansamitocini]